MDVKCKVKHQDICTRMCFPLGGLFTILLGVYHLSSSTFLLIPIGAFLIFFGIFYTRSKAITTDGYVVSSKLLNTVNQNVLPWSDINKIYADHAKAKPDVILIIHTNDITRSCYVNSQDVPYVFAMGRNANPRIITSSNIVTEDEIKAAQEELDKQAN